MITSISLSKAATFNDTPVKLNELKTINFFYGSNGSGKTTIGRVIGDTNSDYPACSIAWAGNASLPTLVYNRDFVERHFAGDDELKGVFTVGEDNVELQAEITTKKEQIEKLKQERVKLDETLNDPAGGKLKQLDDLTTRLDETCWSQKTKHDDDFTEAFKGYMGSKAKFRTKVLTEAANNTADLCNYEDLKKRAATVFGEPPEKLASLAPIDTANLETLENHGMLAKAVVGSADVDIAALIDRLGNADWVRQGTEHLQKSTPQCPFCQQDIPEGLEDDLADYFDSSYQADCDTIKKLANNYTTEAEKAQAAIQAILDDAPDDLDSQVLGQIKQTLDALLDGNKQKWQAKQDAPGTAIMLDSTKDTLAKINTLIEQYNAHAKTHNATVDNLAAEKRRLIGQVWRYLLDVELKTDLANYKTDKEKLDKAIQGLKDGISAKDQAKHTAQNELAELEKKTTSVKPTMDAINQLLASFGFTTFSLGESADKPGSYELIRPNGESARKTLSDGERTFLTFLYFYHLVRGSHDETGTTTKRVVVVDDPVSSIDSDTLFVVSTLLKDIFKQARDGTGNVSQVFAFTHNIYFHKEITFASNRSADIPLSDESFWVVRRLGQQSTAERCEKNPVKSSYELLWEDVRHPKNASHTICNTLRRILEHYFKQLAGIPLDELYEDFDGEEKIICRSLVSWVHDGSHFGMEDHHLSLGQEAIDKYLAVFKRIFETQGHEAHYNMMMGIGSNEEALPSVQSLRDATAT